MIHGDFYSPRLANYVDSLGSREETNLFIPVSITGYEVCSFLVCGAT